MNNIQAVYSIAVLLSFAMICLSTLCTEYTSPEKKIRIIAAIIVVVVYSATFILSLLANIGFIWQLVWAAALSIAIESMLLVINNYRIAKRNMKANGLPKQDIRK